MLVSSVYLRLSKNIFLSWSSCWSPCTAPWSRGGGEAAGVVALPAEHIACAGAAAGTGVGGGEDLFPA